MRKQWPSIYVYTYGNMQHFWYHSSVCYSTHRSAELAGRQADADDGAVGAAERDGLVSDRPTGADVTVSAMFTATTHTHDTADPSAFQTPGGHRRFGRIHTTECVGNVTYWKALGLGGQAETRW